MIPGEKVMAYIINPVIDKNKNRPKKLEDSLRHKYGNLSCTDNINTVMQVIMILRPLTQAEV